MMIGWVQYMELPGASGGLYCMHVQSRHHTVRFNTHDNRLSITNDVSTKRRTWLCTLSDQQTHSYSMTICVRETSVYLFEAVANLLLFVSFLLFRQTLSSWAPFSSTRLTALLTLLNKPFTHLFIPFFCPRSLPAANCCWAPLTWQGR